MTTGNRAVRTPKRVAPPRGAGQPPSAKRRSRAEEDEGNLIKSVGKALAILEELYASGRALRVGDLAARLDMSPSAVSRLVTTLGMSRLVDQDEESGRCHLGMGLALLGHAALGRRELDRIALPVLADLSRRFPAYASLCQLYRDKVIMIRGRTSETLQRDSSLMCVHPVHACASGKLLLAYMEPGDLEAVLEGHRMDPYTPRTITTPEALTDELALIRRDGFAVDDQELLHDSQHVAVPIRNHANAVIAALSVGGRTCGGAGPVRHPHRGGDGRRPRDLAPARLSRSPGSTAEGPGRRGAGDGAMRVCVFGAGAIGGYIAAHLARAPGVEVSVVGRGSQLAAIREHGLRVVGPDGMFTSQVRATDRAEELGPQDYVFITLKSHQVGFALDGLATLIGPETTVIPPTTGIPYWYFHGLPGSLADRRLDALDPGGRQWNVLGPDRVLGCVYWVATEVEAPGVIRHDGAGASFPMGEPDGTLSVRLERLVGAMREGGLKAPVTDNIRGWLWMKMISSLCWNPVATLGHATLGEVHEIPEAVELVRRMMVEAEAVAVALGVQLPITREKRIAATRHAGGHKMSMLQDLERGRPLEIDALAHSIATMRDIAGLATPTIDTVLTLLRLRAHAARSHKDAGAPH